MLQLEGADEAIAYYDEGLRLDPNSWWRNYAVGGKAAALILQGRVAEAVPLAKEALLLNPGAVWTSAYLIIALVGLDRLDEARAALAAVDPAQKGALHNLWNDRLRALMTSALAKIGADALAEGV